MTVFIECHFCLGAIWYKLAVQANTEPSSVTDSPTNYAQFDRCTMLTTSVNKTQCAQHIAHAQVPWEPGLTGLQHGDVLFWSHDVINEILQMAQKGQKKITCDCAHAFINN